jgi:predicted GIY-YIG superfamily endonuclease
VGYTTDYLRRLVEHNEQDNFNTFTLKHRPWILQAVFECGNTKSEA